MDDVLVHYGVKGMKWGVRRTPAQLGHDTGRKKTTNRSIKKQRKKDSKNRRRLSDVDLDQRVNRLKKEKELKKLTYEDIHPGRAAVKNFLSGPAGRVATSAVAGALAYAGHAYVSGNVDMSQLANYVFPNPNRKK